MSTTHQVIKTTLPEAVTAAIEMSKTSPFYACIILSRGKFYVEDNTPFIRIGEECKGHYARGKKMP